MTVEGKAPMTLAKMDSPTLAFGRRLSASERRAEIAAHRESRPCVVCEVPMVAGECVEHGRPAGDGGDWLWAR